MAMREWLRQHSGSAVGAAAAAAAGGGVLAWLQMPQQLLQQQWQ